MDNWVCLCGFDNRNSYKDGFLVLDMSDSGLTRPTDGVCRAFMDYGLFSSFGELENWEEEILRLGILDFPRLTSVATSSQIST